MELKATATKHHHNSLRRSVLKSKGDFFNILNKDVHDVMKNIFNCVNLVSNFTKEPNIKLLLKMHYDLSNIVNNNFDTYNEIQNITIIHDGNQTENMIRLHKVVNKVLKENNFSVYDQIQQKKHKHGRNKTKTKSKSIHVNTSEFEDSDEFNDFVMDFVKKVDKLSIRDFTLPSKSSRRSLSFQRNLKVWDPPLNTEELSIFTNGTHSRRLFSGTLSAVKKYPFVVSIHIMGEFVCVGSIISRDLIITAATCLKAAYQNNFFKKNPRSITVRFGSEYTTRNGETVLVQKLYFHPSYRPRSFRHNLALIRLEKTLRFTSRKQRVRRILWDRASERLNADTKNVVVVGWNPKKADQNVKLTVSIFDTHPLRECREIYTKTVVTEENFCANLTQSRGGACNAHIGAPAIVGNILTGIVSFGAQLCGTVNAPTIFTKLGHYTSWIESIMGSELRPRKSLTFSRRQQNPKYPLSLYAKNYSSMLFRGNYKPADDVKVLRQILQELVQSDSTVVDELLYGELYDEFNDLFISIETKKPISNYKSLKRTTPSLLRTTHTQKISIHKDSQEGNIDYTENYEASSEENQGLSIEVTPKVKVLSNKAKFTKNKSHHITTHKKSTESSNEKLSRSAKETTESAENSLNKRSSEDSKPEISEESLKRTAETNEIDSRSDKQTEVSFETNEQSTNQIVSSNESKKSSAKKQLPRKSLEKAKEKTEEDTGEEINQTSEEIKEVVKKEVRKQAKKKQKVIVKQMKVKPAVDEESSSGDYSTTTRSEIYRTEIDYQSREMKFKLEIRGGPQSEKQINKDIKPLYSLDDIGIVWETTRHIRNVFSKKGYQSKYRRNR